MTMPMQHLPMPFKPCLYNIQFVPEYAARAGQLNWRFTLLREKRSFSCVFSQGVGHIRSKQKLLRNEIAHICAHGNGYGIWLKKPHWSDILSCVQLEVRVIDYPFFETWADEFGYDRDSREAESIYNECRKTAFELQSVLGRELWNTFLSFDFENAPKT